MGGSAWTITAKAVEGIITYNPRRRRIMAYQDVKEKASTQGKGQATETNQAVRGASRRGIAWEVLFGRPGEEVGR